MNTVLYYDLKAISDDDDIDEKAKAFDSCVMIAANSPTIDDIWLDFYISAIDIPRKQMINAIAFFVGAEMITISPSDSELCSEIVLNPYFYLGDNAKEGMTNEYVDCMMEIIEMANAVSEWDIEEIYEEFNE